MKNTLFLIVMTVMTVLLASCEKIDMTEEGNENNTSTSSSKSLKIKTLTGDNSSLHYPITLYAFDTNGRCKATSTISEGVKRENSSFTLQSGEYDIIAVHIPSSYPAQSSSVDANTRINLPSANYATEEFYLGSTRVNLTSNNQTADVTMKLQQTKIEISLTDVPAEVNSVSVGISSPYSKITYSGELSDKQNVVIPCTKSGSKWTTGQFFILPVSSSPVLFTFNMKQTDGKETSYSFSYNGALHAGTPYNFEGQYSSTGNQTQLSLQTNIGIDTWDSTVTKSFTFGPGIGLPATNEDMSVTDFPEDGTIWQGHVVALADIMDDNTCDVMLISLKEWGSVSSANSDNSSEATTLASKYAEDGMEGWSMPTKEEAKVLKDVYSDEGNMAILNNCIESCKGTPLSMVDARYLCEQGTFTFAFKSGSSISAAGTKTEYRMRLVKHITVRKN